MSREHINGPYAMLSQLPQWPPFVPVSSISQTEEKFLAGLFNDINFSSSRSTSWHKTLSVEDRLLVMFRCMRKCGFATLADLLAALFADEYKTRPTVFQTISRFLHETKIGSRPIDILEQMFTHSNSVPSEDEKSKPLVISLLPRYARGPVARLTPQLSERPPESTQSCLLSWAVTKTLYQVNKEADILLHPKTCLDLISHGEALTWTQLLNWRLIDKQEAISQNAPVIFAVLSTVAINKSTRAKLENHVANSQEETPFSADNQDIPDPTHCNPNTVDPAVETALHDIGLQRDAWMVSLDL